jgi:hypothetical protein
MLLISRLHPFHSYCADGRPTRGSLRTCAARSWKSLRLFLLAVLGHARAIRLDLVIAPDVLAHFARHAIALAQGLLSRAIHVIPVFATLRQARRRNGGNRKAEGDSSDVFVDSNHCCLFLKQA